MSKIDPQNYNTRYISKEEIQRWYNAFQLGVSALQEIARVFNLKIGREEREEESVEVQHKPKRVWTEWTVCDECITLNAVTRSIYYRTNGKKVQVKMYYSGKTLTAEASCCPENTFCVDYGVQLAIRRLKKKLYLYEADQWDLTAKAYAKSL